MPFFLAIWVAIIVSSGAGWNLFGIAWDFSNTGTFGDSFGPLSAIMASVAALSAISTLKSQNLEISRIRERESLEDIRAEKADFERAFFQLLEHHRQNVISIDFGSSDSHKTGQDAFKSMEYRMRNNSSQGFQAARVTTYDKYKNDLGHYFRFLYHLIRFVHNSNISEKYFYIQLVRATLSEAELIFIALNCAYGEGFEKFKPLVEEYCLLHNLSEQSLGKYQILSLFDPTAFEKQAI